MKKSFVNTKKYVRVISTAGKIIAIAVLLRLSFLAMAACDGKQIDTAQAGEEKDSKLALDQQQTSTEKIRQSNSKLYDDWNSKKSLLSLGVVDGCSKVFGFAIQNPSANIISWDFALIESGDGNKYVVEYGISDSDLKINSIHKMKETEQADIYFDCYKELLPGSWEQKNLDEKRDIIVNFMCMANIDFKTAMKYSLNVDKYQNEFLEKACTMSQANFESSVDIASKDGIINKDSDGRAMERMMDSAKDLIVLHYGENVNECDA